MNAVRATVDVAAVERFSSGTRIALIGTPDNPKVSCRQHRPTNCSWLQRGASQSGLRDRRWPILLREARGRTDDLGLGHQHGFPFKRQQRWCGNASLRGYAGCGCSKALVDLVPPPPSHRRSATMQVPMSSMAFAR